MSTYITTPQTKKTIEALWRLEKIILEELDFSHVVDKIVNGLLMELDYLKLGYRIIVLTLVDQKKGVLRRVSLSQTHEAEMALAASAVPFHKIEIPLSAHENLLIKTMEHKIPYVTHYWPDLFTPALTPEQAIFNQKSAGIKTSLVYPVIVRDRVIGVLIFSMVKEVTEVSNDEKDLILGFTDIVGLAVQNAQLYTTLQETAAKLEHANKRLQEIDKLKDEFVSVASHELRTPMTAIRSYLWMTLAGKGGKLEDKQKFYLDRAYNSTTRLIKLVNDMLNVSRIESGRISIEVKKVDLEKMSEEAIGEVAPRATELGINLVLQKSLTPLYVIADADKIKEVLINLVGNSIKFTPKGGTITVSFAVKEGMVVTSVTDTGVGIAPENMPRLFQKFAMVKASYVVNEQVSSGTGLGLYICKSIVEIHGGTIWGTSAGINQGSTFGYSLKLYTQEEFERLEAKYKGHGEVGIIHTAA